MSHFRAVYPILLGVFGGFMIGFSLNMDPPPTQPFIRSPDYTCAQFEKVCEPFTVCDNAGVYCVTVTCLEGRN